MDVLKEPKLGRIAGSDITSAETGKDIMINGLCHPGGSAEAETAVAVSV